MLLKCNCSHDYQDTKYGKGMRVHNYAKGANNKAGGWRCTVCCSEKNDQKETSVNTTSIKTSK